MSDETRDPEADPQDAEAPEAPGDEAAEEAPATPPKPESRGRLRRRRRDLLDRRQEAVYHLGGLAFELYRRDLLAEPVMRRRAEEVAEIDRSVREIDERLQELTERPPRARRAAATAGECPSCGAAAVVDARYCWNCGVELRPPEAPAEAGEPDPSDAPTGLVDASDEPTSVVPRLGEDGR